MHNACLKDTMEGAVSTLETAGLKDSKHLHREEVAMKLSSMTQEELITLQKDVANKEEAIDVLLELFKEKYNPNLDYKGVKEKIMAREARSCTTYPNGLSIPHTRVEEIDDVVFGILTPKKPFQDNGTTVHMMVVILSSSSSSTIYLKVLSALSALLSDAHEVSDYSVLTRTSDFIHKIVENDVYLTTELNVHDVIDETFLSLHPANTVAEAIHIMSQTNSASLPVCDDNKRFLGVVNFSDVIAIGIPEYAQMLTSMKFAANTGPMERLFRNEDKILVREIMHKAEITVNYTESLVHVLLLMIKQNKLFFPVIEGETCRGIITYKTLIDNYLIA